MTTTASGKGNRPQSRFALTPFENRAGSTSWRVSGTRRDGTRVRMNFADARAAQLKQIELEAEWHTRQPEANALRATRLTDDQLRICEAALPMLDDDSELLRAVTYWLSTGRAASTAPEAPRLDEAVEQFVAWVRETPTMRPTSKRVMRTAAVRFSNNQRNVKLSDVTAETIERHLALVGGSPVTRDNIRRLLHRFFAWCAERPRHWIRQNPCAAVRVEQGERHAPEILTLRQCARLLAASKRHLDGKAVTYVAVCMFGGLRPTEAKRLRWDQVNLDDGEIRLEGSQTKTGTGRVVKIDETLAAWLRWADERGLHSFAASRRTLETVRRHARLGEWVPDVLRHTCISHFFRRSGSFGLSAEQFGNSEQIIKRHYAARTSSAESAKFWAMFPERAQRHQHAANTENIIAIETAKPARRSARATR